MHLLSQEEHWLYLSMKFVLFSCANNSHFEIQSAAMQMIKNISIGINFDAVFYSNAKRSQSIDFLNGWNQMINSHLPPTKLEIGIFFLPSYNNDSPSVILTNSQQQ